MGSVQQGTTKVEVAVISAAGLIVLIGIVEVIRALLVWNSITEATRRGAHVAAICPMYHPAVKRAVMFGKLDSGDSSPVLAGLSRASISLLYLDKDGNVTMDYPEVAYVRIGIYNYQHSLLVPFVRQTITVPGFSTTLPSESLGYIPVLGTRQCFGF